METEILKKRFNEILNLLLELENLKSYIKFLHNPHEEYFDSVAKDSDFFARVFKIVV